MHYLYGISENKVTITPLDPWSEQKASIRKSGNTRSSVNTLKRSFLPKGQALTSFLKIQLGRERNKFAVRMRRLSEFLVIVFFVFHAFTLVQYDAEQFVELTYLQFTIINF